MVLVGKGILDIHTSSLLFIALSIHSLCISSTPAYTNVLVTLTATQEGFSGFAAPSAQARFT